MTGNMGLQMGECNLISSLLEPVAAMVETVIAIATETPMKISKGVARAVIAAVPFGRASRGLVAMRGALCEEEMTVGGTAAVEMALQPYIPFHPPRARSAAGILDPKDALAQESFLRITNLYNVQALVLSIAPPAPKR